jgi:S1-C subfamily serine protease
VYGSLVDLVLLVLIAVFAINGYRQGFFVGLLSFVGFFGGAALGLQLGPRLAGHVDSDGLRIVIALGTVFGLAIAGQAGAGWAGARIRSAIRSNGARRIDDIGGAVVSVIALLAVAWLVAAPLGSAPIRPLASSVRHSAILHGVDTVMPSEAETLSESLRETIDTNGFPDVLGGLDPTRVRQVPPPDSALANSPVVQQARSSVVKIRGTATSCNRMIEGSGFFYAPHHVLTNAHVVAGTKGSLTVEQDGQTHRGRVVAYNPEIDLAVVYVADLTGPVLSFSEDAAASGDDAIILGYPLDGDFNVQPARIRDSGPIRGPDIYGAHTVTRDVYTLRGLVQNGNSGGPLLDTSGRVLGVIFAAAADNDDIGFALTLPEVTKVATPGESLTSPVSTGDCADG